jgi:hypothetical protein
MARDPSMRATVLPEVEGDSVGLVQALDEPPDVRAQHALQGGRASGATTATAEAALPERGRHFEADEAGPDQPGLVARFRRGR